MYDLAVCQQSFLEGKIAGNSCLDNEPVSQDKIKYQQTVLELTILGNLINYIVNDSNEDPSVPTTTSSASSSTVEQNVIHPEYRTEVNELKEIFH